MKPTKLVLLVEDNELCAKYFGLILEEALCLQVHAVKSGLEALEFLSDNKPDLIHMDIQLPGISGWDTIERIAAQPKLAEIPICVVTACGLFYTDRYDALRDRVAQAWHKPMLAPDYAKMILHLLFPQTDPGDSEVAGLLRSWTGAAGRLVVH
jgi:CheY-like chemotaxis protein